MSVKFIATCVEAETARRFRELCKEEGVSQYGKVAELIEGYVESLEKQKKNIIVVR